MHMAVFSLYMQSDIWVSYCIDKDRPFGIHYLKLSMG